MICGRPLPESWGKDWRCSNCDQIGCSNGTIFIPLLVKEDNE